LQNLYLIESKGFLLDYDCLKLQENGYYALKVCKIFEVVGSANPRNELYTRQAKDPQRSILGEQWKILLNTVDSHL
jgi:hypothetical protein